MSEEKITLSNGQLRELDIEQGHPDFPELKYIQGEMYGQRRWSVLNRVTIQRTTDNTFWQGTYEQAATENQDQGAYDDRTVTLARVYPHRVVTTVYRSTPPQDV